MNDMLRVFVVDNDPDVCASLAATLDGLCDFEIFPSAADCRTRVAACRPDLLIVEVTMCGPEGCAKCRQFTDDSDISDIPVIFVSAGSDPDTCLACYEAGGYDFIQKPIVAAELRNKLKVATRILGEKAALREQAGYAQQTAMSAMVSMGELGVVLQFLSKSFSCEQAEEVAAALVEAMGQYDLQAAVQVRLGDEVLSLSRNGRNLPLEASVLSHVREAGRIFQFRSRCVFNYGRVTLMVNNLPLEDAERCGRIRDNGALLAEGADARLKAIEADLLAQRRRDGIEAALPQLYSTLDGVQNNYRRNCFELTQVMIDFQESLSKAFIHLGLTESQEAQVGQMANDFMLRVVGTQDAALNIVGQLEQLADDLKELLRN